jgi:hypothetical protein
MENGGWGVCCPPTFFPAVVLSLAERSDAYYKYILVHTCIHAYIHTKVRACVVIRTGKHEAGKGKKTLLAGRVQLSPYKVRRHTEVSNK